MNDDKRVAQHVTKCKSCDCSIVSYNLKYWYMVCAFCASEEWRN